MPEYTYTDGTTTITVIHPMEWDGEIISGTGVPYWRMPSHIAAVHWADGLSPSAIEGQSPEIREHIKSADRLRDEYGERKQDD